MTVASLASPITPFSSTIRPWTSLVCKITVSFSSLLGDSTGVSFASADSAVVGVAASVVGAAGVPEVAGFATTAGLSAGAAASSA